MTQKQRIVYYILWGSGVIITLFISYGILGNTGNIIPYIFIFYPIFLVVWVLYIMPLEWITIKIGFFKRTDLYSPNTNRMVLPSRSRSRGSDCDCHSSSRREEE
jgi:hypothetical protein